ncbi:ABC transporter permease [Dyadobacter sp. 32]|uniref:ABC transporter permease n=1 Tax=Dyadobacter sp. 32 TaxID=538966 RepID=UPI0011EDBCE0
MTTSINLEIALTYLISKKKQTIIASLGVMFGIGMFILMNSLISGTNEYFEEMTFSATPHIRLYRGHELSSPHMLTENISDSSKKIISNPQLIFSDNRISNPDAVIEAIKHHKEVFTLFPLVTANVIYSHAGVEKNGNLNGTDIIEQDKMFDLASTMTAGSVRDLDANPDGIMIGAILASDLNLSRGDYLTVSTASGTMKRLKVTGIFKTTIKAVDEGKAYASLAVVQQLLRKDRSFISDIYINIKNYNSADEVATQLTHLTGYNCESWQSANEQNIAARMIRDIIANSVVITILIVAGFGIYNILNMMIYEKIKEIAILKATGFAGKHIVSIFIYQALFIGLIGGSAGLLFGWLSSVAGSNVYIGKGTLEYLPMTFDIKHYVQGFSFGLITSFFAGYIPAVKASKVDPVEIIRG